MNEETPMEPCAMGIYCHKHRYIHGGEAEELREKIENTTQEK